MSSLTEYLFEALKDLWFPDKEDRYLSLDAMCIHQNDAGEKAVQTRNMLMIY
ncbi:hypothetical protein BDW02DRAFT_600514 [Decorospora gaudefroyi]|uniref:Heterokaryon incompatibility domain-containing protein n=1 Tax=Decorospora gaudefroyi TaxID=184978 RepID=A0A6A5K595_9PLEO|nr:hypothetical protein BDW02DRAFT_600514 [Decorospora gaudefroyi]